MSKPVETLRAILEAIPHPGGMEALAELGTEMAELRSVMGAAAVELDAHWAAHCDADGYGPVNLQRRLERGVAVEYSAFTAKGWAAQQARIAELEAHIHTLREELERLRPYLRHNEICSFANKGNAEICCICGLNAATEVKP